MHGSEGWHLHWSAGGCVVEFVWRCCQTKSTSEKMHFPEFNCFLWSFKSGIFGHLMHWANYLISTCPGNGGLLFGLQWAEPFLGWIWFRGHCFWNLRASWRMGEYGRSKMRANALEGFRPGYKLQAVRYKFCSKGLQIPDIHGKTTTQKPSDRFKSLLSHGSVKDELHLRGSVAELCGDHQPSGDRQGLRCWNVASSPFTLITYTVIYLIIIYV